MKKKITCPHCGGTIEIYQNPLPAADTIIELTDHPGTAVLIQRKNPPYGWAIPGGFVDVGESMEEAAAREALEETGLEVFDLHQFHTYSDPARDPRHHTITTVFTAQARGTPQAGDDASAVGIFTPDTLPDEIAFDHRDILAEYFSRKHEG